ncbi:hypothetical protein ScPMuIL_011863 [Solemya velum]
MAVFRGCIIALDLTTSVSFKKKTEIKRKIIENQGVVSYIVTKKCTHVVASDPEKADVSYKCRMAAKYGLPVISPDFIHDSVEKQKLLNTDDYILVGKTKAEEFGCGKVVASKYQKKEKKKKASLFLNTKSVKVWPHGDKNAPLFDENKFEIAKYSMFKKNHQKAGKSDFCVLELHATTDDKLDLNSADVFSFRIFSHHGNLNENKECIHGTKECRFVRNSDEALALYAQLYKEQLEYPSEKTVTHELVGRNLGSDRFQQMQAKFGLEFGRLDSEVAELVEHIWREAAGEIEDLLSLPINKVKIDQVEKAEAVLVQIKEQLASNKDDSAMTSLVEEFYIHLPHNPQYIINDVSKSWLAKQQDICQLIRDMLSVSETTNWFSRSNAESKLRALRCHIEHIKTDDSDFRIVSEIIAKSKQR